jgi:hypothetical protein
MRDFPNLLGLLLIGSLSLSAFFTALSVLFPKRAVKTRTVADLMPGRATLVGLVNFLFFGAAGLILLTIANQVSNGVLKIIFTVPALVCLALLFGGLSFGLAGVAQLAGARLAPGRSDVTCAFVGSLALGWGSVLPIVGWFLLLPYIGWLGLGAFIIGFFYRERPPTMEPL